MQVAQRDYVKVTGKVGKPYDGTNGFGVKIKAVTIGATSIEKLSYTDVMAPTQKEVVCALVQDQYGYSVTVDKVEFAEDETRIYLTASNGGSDKFSLYSFNAKVLQGGRQYGEEMSYGSGLPELESELMVGASTSGVITFPAIEQAPFHLVCEAHSYNYNERIADYVFDVAV